MIEGERKLVTVRRIAAIDPIEGADRIVRATIDGWELVTQKGNYEPGDLCVYFEIDSFLPVREEFEFLRKGCFKDHPELGEGFRIKTIKLRGQVSQGLSLPLKDFFEYDEKDANWYFRGNENPDYLREGDDLTEWFGVKKYEKPEAGPGGNKFGPSSARGSFPHFIPKTDQERVQNCWGGVRNWVYYDKPVVTEVTDPQMLADIESLFDVSGWHEKLKFQGKAVFKSGDQYFLKTMTPFSRDVTEDRRVFEVSVKLDGSSMTIYHNDGQVGVCSRNLDLKRNPDNLFWKTALETELLGYLVQNGENLAVQGELMGPGVQGNRENLDVNKFYVFDVYDIDLGRYMTPSERAIFIEDFYFSVEGTTLEHVPIVNAYFDVYETMEVPDFLLLADSQASVSNPVAEGLVFKSHYREGPTFKAISNRFLLAEKD